MVSKIGKNVSDHGDFVKAKEELEEWIKQARVNVQECVGDGDLEWIDAKLNTLDQLLSRMIEGELLYSDQVYNQLKKCLQVR